jgi:hypothetical protein
MDVMDHPLSTKPQFQKHKRGAIRTLLRRGSSPPPFSAPPVDAELRGHGDCLPNSRLSPGAFTETRTAAIYVRGYDRPHRVWHDKAATLAKYPHR